MNDEQPESDRPEIVRAEPQTNQMLTRQFGGMQLAANGPATQALVAKETAMIQSRCIVAMQAPRNLHNVRTMMIQECRQPGFAEKAMYSVPRGGGRVVGMSIRFAEVALRVLGNMACEATTIFDSDSERLIRVLVTDYETNAHWQRDITVKKTIERKELRRGEQPIRTRVNSSHETIFICEATDDDVRTKEAAEISKASRTGILRLVPGYLVNEMRALCENLQADKARKDPNGELKKIVDAFAEIRVPPSDLEALLGHVIDQITPGELLELQLVFRGIREGEVTWREVADDAEKYRERAKAATKAKREAERAAKKPEAGVAPAGGAAPATSTTTDTKPSTAAPTTQGPAVAQDIGKTAKDPSPDIKPTPAGKGTQAVKDKVMAGAAKSEPAVEKPVEKPVESAAPAPLKLETQTASDFVNVDCSICGVPVSVTKGADAAGVQCDACANW